MQGGRESTLSIYWWNEGSSTWEKVESKLDRKGRVLTARVNHFSIYSIQVQYVDPTTPNYGGPANPSFNQVRYSVAGGPDNGGFDTSGYLTSQQITNGDFETGDLTGWTVTNNSGGVGGGSFDGSRYAYVRPSWFRPDGETMSSSFTVPDDAQMLRFRASCSMEGAPYTYFRMYRVSDGKLLEQKDTTTGGLDDWRLFEINVTPYRDIPVRIDFYATRYTVEMRIDHLVLSHDVPGWDSPTGTLKIANQDPTSGPYVSLSSGSDLSSVNFTVPSDAQSLHFRSRNSAGGAPATNFRLYRASDNAVLVESTITTTTWNEFEVNLMPYRGTTVRANFTSSPWTDELCIDEVTLYHEIPGWEVTSGDNFGLSSRDSHAPGSGAYAKLGPGATLSSSNFTIPDGTKFMRFWTWSTNSPGSAVFKLYRTSDNSLLTQQDITTARDWRQRTFDVGLWAGTTVRVEFLSGGYTAEMRVDDIVLDTSGTFLGNPENCESCGQPVSMTTGNMTHTWEDLSIPGMGLGLSLSRSYNSMGSTTLPFGKGWTFNYGMRLDVNSDSSVFVTHPDGRAVLYTRNADGSYARPLGVYEILVRNGDGSYTLTDKTQTRFNFGVDGKLTSVADKNGNSIALSYSGGVLSSVSDPSGRSLSFSYGSGSQLIQQVTDPASRVYRYTYDDAGNLVAYTDPLNGVTTYEYGPFGMIRATDQAGHVIFDNGYDSRGRIVEQLDHFRNISTFTYDVPNRTTTFTDFEGRTHTTVFDTAGRTVSSRDGRGYAEGCTYDAAGNRDSVTDRNSGITRYQYDSMGNVTWVTDPLGGVSHTTYDSKNNPTSKTDALNRTTYYGYDLAGNLTAITDAASGITLMGYDPYGQLSSTQDPLGNRMVYGYDTAGNQNLVSDALGRQTTRTFDSAGRLKTETDPLQHTSTYDYRADGKLTSVTNALNRVTGYAYDRVGNRTAITDVAGHTTLYTYDEKNRLTYVTDANSGTTTYSYDKTDLKKTTKDALGRLTRYDYDARGKLSSETPPLPAGPTSYGYDGVGNLTTVTDATSRTTLSGYDGASRKVTSTDSAGKLTRYAYDRVGNRTNVTDATNRTVTLVYDSLNRLTEERDNLAHSELYGYDAAGRKTSFVDPNLNQTRYGYDGLGHLTYVTDASNGVVSYEYDGAGNRTAMVDANQHRTAYTFDAINRLRTETDPESRVTTTSYDDLASRVTINRPDNTNVVRELDALGRTAKITYPDRSISYGYDAASQIRTMSDSLGTTNYGYDGAGRVISVTSPQGIVGYGYDSAGRRNRVDYPGGGSVTYTYDAAGRMWTLTDWANKTVTYSYDDAGRLLGQANPNGTTGAYGYDSAGTLSSIAHRGPGNGTIASFTYSPDAAGNPLSVSEQMSLLPGGTTTYSYDTLSRLRTVTYPDATWSSYRYDPMGNRTELGTQSGTTTYSYDRSDRLLSTSGAQSLSFSWDARGNQTGKGTSSFTYDAADRLTSSSTGSSVSYSYNGEGVRVGKSVNGSATTYLQDVVGGLPRVLVESTFVAPTPTVTPLTSASLSATPVSPQPSGASVSLTATSAPSGSPAEYKWWVAPVGGSWTLLRDWGGATYTWDTNGLTPGDYAVVTWARALGSANSYDAVASVTYSLSVPRVGSVSISSAPSSPAATGARIALSASPSPRGITAEYLWWIFPPGASSWSVLRDWGGSSYSWNTAGLVPGNYSIAVWARAFGSPEPYDASASFPFTLGAAGLTSASISASPGSPQPSGATVSLTASSSPSGQPAEYLWWIYAPGGSSWTLLRDWGGESYTWDTRGLASGSYSIAIWARLVGSANPYDTTAALSFTLGSGGLTSVSIAASPSPPSPSGTSVTFTAASLPSTIPTEYLWWIFPPGASSWLVLRDWGGPSYTWNTLGLAPGDYSIAVWARTAGSSASYEAIASIAHTLSASAPRGQTLYVYGVGLAYEVRPDGSRRYYHSDSLGSTRVVTDDAGVVVSAFSYDAYGTLRQSAGEGRGFTYTGEQTDAESGLEFLRARYYDPGMGRFISKDSLAVSNRYSYGDGNPLRYTDPSGHFPWLLGVVLFSGALSAFDIGTSVHTANFDPNATPEERNEARANLGTYVTAAQIDGPAPVGDFFGIVLGAARGGRKAVTSAVRYADEVLQRGVPIGTGVGQWVRNAPSMAEEAKLYQEYVTGAPYGFEFLRNGIHFDGIRLTETGEAVLLDAKCASSAEKSLYGGVNDPKKPFAEQRVLGEARRQLKAANGIRIEWHVRDPSAAEVLGEFLARNRIPIDVIHTAWTP